MHLLICTKHKKWERKILNKVHYIRIPTFKKALNAGVGSFSSITRLFRHDDSGCTDVPKVKHLAYITDTVWWISRWLCYMIDEG